MRIKNRIKEKRSYSAIFIIFFLLLMISTFSYPTVSYSQYYLVYQANLSIKSIISENYNASITLYIKNFSNNEVVFSVIGTGNLYSFAKQTNFNISKVILMDACNGTYTKPIGLDEGFPMLNTTELEALASGKLSGNNCACYNVSKEVINVGGTEYQTYKIYGSKSELSGSGSICIWVNQSNGVIIKIIEKASNYLGTITITATLVKSSLPSYSTNTSLTTTINSTTTQVPSHYSDKPENFHSNFTTLIIIGIIAIVAVLAIVLKKVNLSK